MKKFALILAVIVILFVLSGCGLMNPTPENSAAPQLSASAEEDTLSASGEVVPEKYVSLGFAAGGQRLAVLVQPGQTVRAAQLLARVDDTTLAAALEAARAQMDSAKSSLERLRDNDAAEADLLAGKAAVEAAKAALAQAGDAFAATRLVAPYDGTVVEIYQHSGETAAPGQPLLLLADLSSLRVRTTDLSEVDAARIQTGDPAEVTFDALPNTSVAGKVRSITLRNSPGSGVYYTAEIELERIPAELRWGMSAFVVFRP